MEISRAIPLRLELQRMTSPFDPSAFLPLPLEPFFHRTDHLLYSLALQFLERATPVAGTYATRQTFGFPIHTVNYYDCDNGCPGWHHRIILVPASNLAWSGNSLHCLWFKMSHFIDRQFDSQIMPRHDMRRRKPTTW